MRKKNEAALSHKAHQHSQLALAGASSQEDKHPERACTSCLRVVLVVEPLVDVSKKKNNDEH